jgi:hypothetical protein
MRIRVEADDEDEALDKVLVQFEDYPRVVGAKNGQEYPIVIDPEEHGYENVEVVMS